MTPTDDARPAPATQASQRPAAGHVLVFYAGREVRDIFFSGEH